MNLVQFNAQIVPLRNKLYRLALRITRSGHEAEDVVQEVFEKIWRRKDQDASIAITNWEAMSMTMTRNLSIDKSRAKHHQLTGPLPERFDLADSAKTPEQLAQANDTFHQVEWYMASLPEKQRTVMHLRDIEELSYEEIAETMQISLDDVKVTLHRARKFIREKLLQTQRT